MLDYVPFLVLFSVARFRREFIDVAAHDADPVSVCVFYIFVVAFSSINFSHALHLFVFFSVVSLLFCDRYD